MNDASEAARKHLTGVISSIDLSNPKEQEYVEFVTRTLGISSEVARANFAFLSARQSIPAGSNNSTVPLPTAAPDGKFYEDCGHTDAERFLHDNYGFWLKDVDTADKENILYRPLLRQIDPKLVTALENKFRGRPDDFAKLLPTKRAQIDARLEKSVGHPLSGADRKRALTNLHKGRLPKPHA